MQLRNTPDICGVIVAVGGAEEGMGVWSVSCSVRMGSHSRAGSPQPLIVYTYLAEAGNVL